MSALFDPANVLAADFVPFFHDGKYHVFYLGVSSDAGDEASPVWRHAVTRDFVAFEERPPVVEVPELPRKTMNLFGGSVVQKDGAFHFFYTDCLPGTEATGNHAEQVVRRAVSHDLHEWRRDEEFVLRAEGPYNPGVWRAPHVFRAPDTGGYAMLLTSAHKEQAIVQRGCIALATSDDLESWTIRPPFWAPDTVATQEAPNLFHLGKWWYLVYTTYGRGERIHYRMSRRLGGPWTAPDRDGLWAGALCAPRIVGPETAPHCFGWIPARKGEKDRGVWQWGGAMTALALRQRADGTLALRLPDTTENAFPNAVRLDPTPLSGEWETGPTEISTAGYQRIASVRCAPMPERGLLRTEVELQEKSTDAGILLRANAKRSWYYQLHLDRHNQLFRLDRWPLPGNATFTVERPISIQPNRPIKLDVLVDGTALVACVNGDACLCARFYEHGGDSLQFYVTEGDASFRNTTLRTT